MSASSTWPGYLQEISFICGFPTSTQSNHNGDMQRFRRDCRAARADCTPSATTRHACPSTSTSPPRAIKSTASAGAGTLSRLCTLSVSSLASRGARRLPFVMHPQPNIGYVGCLQDRSRLQGPSSQASQSFVVPV